MSGVNNYRKPEKETYDDYRLRKAKEEEEKKNWEIWIKLLPIIVVVGIILNWLGLL